MLKLLILLCLLIFTAVRGGDRCDFSEAELQKCSASQDLFPVVKGVIIMEGKGFPPEYVYRSTRSVYFYRCDSGLKNSQKENLSKRLGSFILGKKLTMEKLDEAKLEISRCYGEYGKSFVVVVCPEQDITEGVIIFNVIEGYLSEIKVKGNMWFKKEAYIEQIRLSEHESIDQKILEEDLTWINRSPSKKVCAVFSPGSRPGTTDLNLMVEDYKPIRFYSGANNTGLKDTGDARIFFGFNWSNGFNASHIMAYQYISSADFYKFQAHMFEYSLPLPWRNMLDFYGGYSLVKVDDESDATKLTQGQSWQLTTKYNYFLQGDSHLTHQLDGGVHVKRANNSFLVGGSKIASTLTTELQFLLFYGGKWQIEKDLSLHYKLKSFIAPLAIGDGMSQTAYDQLRVGAKRHYYFLRPECQLYTKVFEEWTLEARMMGQVASGPLLPLEQFGLGGVNSVRGYDNRAFNADNGMVINIDLGTPKINFERKSYMKLTQKNEGFSGVIFADFGCGGTYKTAVVKGNSKVLFGVGPGVRYNYQNYLLAKIDLGIKLINLKASPQRVQLQANLIASY